MRTHSINELTTILKEYFSKTSSQQEQIDIDFVYLFGSYLDLEVDCPQDIDIAVHFNIANTKKTSNYYHRLIDFEYELGKLLNYKIDIHAINDLDIDTQIEIINNGLIVYCKNEKKLCNYIEALSRKACETEYSRILMKQIRDKIYESI